MAEPLTQAGTYRGDVTDYSLQKYDSGAQAIRLTVLVKEVWNGEDDEWQDCTGWDMETKGNVFIVKKDGTINSRGAESLIQHAGWPGDVMAVLNRTWQPTPIQVTVGEEEYKGEVSYRINWINEYDRKPGSGNVSPEEAQRLQDRHGAAFRALAGNQARNAPKPAGGPQKPPETQSTSPPAKPLDPNAVLQEAAEEGKDKIPF